MLKIAIVDDENKAVENLRLIINGFVDDAEVVGEANGVVDGVKMIQQSQPDVVLLDIDMPPYTGFDLLEMIPERAFKVIFITAHDKHAIRAFKFSAVDYILKPVVIPDFIAAVESARDLVSEGKVLDVNTEVLLQNLNTPQPKKLIVHSNQGIDYLEIDKLLYIKSEGSYCELYSTDGKRHVVVKSLKEFEDELEGSSFFRTHKSFMINLNRVSRYMKEDGGTIELENGEMIEISRRKKAAFIKAMEDNI